MRTHIDCLPCFVNQAVSVLRRMDIGDQPAWEVLRRIIHEIGEYDLSRSPPCNAASIYRSLERLTGRGDPYSREKVLFNRFALDVAAGIGDPPAGMDQFEFRLRCAMAANLIDFGIHGSIDTHETERFLQAAVTAEVDRQAVARLRGAVERARRILYICDNAGEIVFDRCFIQCLPVERITAVVRGFPVINDATMEDAQQTGLCDLVRVIDNGMDVPGTVLAECSGEVRQSFHEADLVISKGQGNFETLDEVEGKQIFFLLTVKCPVVSRKLSRSMGSLVIEERGRGEARDPG